MKRLAIVMIVVLSACTTTERRNFCEEKLAIAVVEKPAGEVETADNEYDTDATVANVKAHNAIIDRVCAAVPAPQR